MPVGVYPRTEAHRAINQTHGACSGGNRTPEYRAWRHMHSRCYNTNSKDYPDYGGRGIYVCQQWFTFEVFLADMGPRPSFAHSIDRRDSNGPYEPDNCRWATATEQVRGRRKAIYATVDGERLPLIEWAKRLGLSYQTIHARLRRHSPEHAVAMGGKRLTDHAD